METKYLSIKFKSSLILTMIFSYINTYQKVRSFLKQLSKKGISFLENNDEQLKYFCSHSKFYSRFQISGRQRIHLEQQIQVIDELSIELLKALPKLTIGLHHIKRIKRLELNIYFESFSPQKECIDGLIELAGKSQFVLFNCYQRVRFQRFFLLQSLFASMKQQKLEIYEFGVFDKESLSYLSNQFNIVTLHLKVEHQEKFQEVQSNFEIESLKQLEEFSCKGHYIYSDIQLLRPFIDKMSKLRVLKLDNNIDAAQIDLRHLGVIEHLEELKLTAVTFYVEILDQFPNLQKLHVEFIWVINSQKEAPPPCLPKIEVLKLISQKQMSDLDQIFQHLESVQIAEFSRIKTPWSLISKNCSSLVQLSISKCIKFEKETLKHLNSFRYLHTLIIDQFDKSQEEQEHKQIQQKQKIVDNYSIKKFKLTISDFEKFKPSSSVEVPLIDYLKHLKNLRKLHIAQTSQEIPNYDHLKLFFSSLCKVHPALKLKLSNMKEPNSFLYKPLQSNPMCFLSLDLEIKSFFDLAVLAKCLKQNKSLVQLKVMFNSFQDSLRFQTFFEAVRQHPKLKRLYLTVSDDFQVQSRFQLRDVILNNCKNLEELRFYKHSGQDLMGWPEWNHMNDLRDEIFDKGMHRLPKMKIMLF